MTPLMVAALHGHAEIIKCLILHEVDVLIEDKNGKIAVDYIKNAPRAFQYLSEETLVRCFGWENDEIVALFYQRLHRQPTGM